MRRVIFGVVITAAILLLMFTGHGGPAYDDTGGKSWCGTSSAADSPHYSARCIGK